MAHGTRMNRHHKERTLKNFRQRCRNEWRVSSIQNDPDYFEEWVRKRKYTHVRCTCGWCSKSRQLNRNKKTIKESMGV